MSYQLNLSEETLLKINSYRKSLADSKKEAGPFFDNKLKAHGIYTKKQIGALTLEQFIDILVDSKKPHVFAESNFHNWTIEEGAILGDLGLAAEVTLFDQGEHNSQGKPTPHDPPMKGTLLFSPGALMMEGSPDYQEVVREGKIDSEKYYKLYERRLLPLLKYANQAAKNKKALITVPGIGCGAFAGNFSKVMRAEFLQVLKRLLQEHGKKLDHIQLLRFDAANNQKTGPGPSQEMIHNIDFRVRPCAYEYSPENQALAQPQLCSPEKYQENKEDDFKDCCFFSIVAWDHYSWPGNDFYGGARQTDDGVKAAATNIMRIMTGFLGKYFNGRYNPPDSYATWGQVVQQNNLSFSPAGKIFISVPGKSELVKLEGNRYGNKELRSFRKKEEQEIIDKTWNNLFSLVNKYLHKNTSSNVSYFQEFRCKLLTDGKSKLAQIISFQKKLDLISQNKAMDHHGTTGWRDFVRQAYNFLSVLTVLPALVRGSYSYFHYGTASFWKPQSRKIIVAMKTACKNPIIQSLARSGAS